MLVFHYTTLRLLLIILISFNTFKPFYLYFQNEMLISFYCFMLITLLCWFLYAYNWTCHNWVYLMPKALLFFLGTDTSHVFKRIPAGEIFTPLTLELWSLGLMSKVKQEFFIHISTLRCLIAEGSDLYYHVNT